MMEYSVYNETTGSVLRSGYCPQNMFLDIEKNLLPNEKIINKKIDDLTEKISNGKAILIPQDELDLRTFNERKNSIPKLDLDKPANEQINKYFKGFLPDTTQWRKDNYATLRKQSYPDATEFLDAQVKLASDNLTLKEEGQLQLKAYTQDCLAVKTRFPKKV